MADNLNYSSQSPSGEQPLPNDPDALLREEGVGSGAGGVLDGGIMLDRGAAAIPSGHFANQLFLDPTAAIVCAASLPGIPSKEQPQGITLQSGLSADSPPGPTFADQPPIRAFFDDVWSKSFFLTPEKVSAFLDGGYASLGVLGSFRVVRRAVLRLDASRSPSSVSGSACVDGRYFARQIFLMLLARAHEDIVLYHENAGMDFLSVEQQADVLRFKGILEAGGVEAVKRGIDDAAENAGILKQEWKRRVKKAALLKANRGAPLSEKQEKELRDAASSAKSNEKRKKLYDLTREMAEETLAKRWELRDAAGRAFCGDFFQAGPMLSASQQFAPVPEA